MGDLLDDLDKINRELRGLQEVLEGKKKRRKKKGRGRSAGKRRNKPYTKGELNKLIDDLIHPFAREEKAYYLLDGVLHGIVERDPNESIRKFIQYNLPKMLEENNE